MKKKASTSSKEDLFASSTPVNDEASKVTQDQEVDQQSLSNASELGTLSSESVEVFDLCDLKETVLNKIITSKNHNSNISSILNGKFADQLKDETNSEKPVSKMNNIRQEFLEYESKAQENYKQARRMRVQEVDDLDAKDDIVSN